MDIVKCNMQIDPLKYKGIGSSFSTIVKEAGIGGLYKGWVPTLYGYGAQGCFKFALYEYFKK
jgi:solute carrier family 25 phosphate transporter 3